MHSSDGRNKYGDWRSSIEHYYELAVWDSSDNSCLVCLVASLNEREPSLLHVVELSIKLKCRGATKAAEVPLLLSCCSTSALQPALELQYMK